MPRQKNLRPDLNGLLVINKPAETTSAAVCSQVRRVSGRAKVGHAGTLDPMATGVLVLALGKATKAIPKIQASAKRYRASVDFSAFSSTDDAEGELCPVEAAPTPRERLEEALDVFTGRIMQRPPLYSAVQMGGRRAYHLARSGELDEDALSERAVDVHSIELLDYEWPRAVLDIHCGKGTYVRSLARDLGRFLGVGGHLAALRRTAVGNFTLDQAIDLDELTAPLAPEDLLPFTPPPTRGERRSAR